MTRPMFTIVILFLLAVAGCGGAKQNAVMISDEQRGTLEAEDNVGRKFVEPIELDVTYWGDGRPEQPPKFDKSDSNYVPDWEHEADYNMPPKAELTEPRFWPDDIVYDSSDGPEQLYRIKQVCWMRSRKYPNGGYRAHPVDGWWYLCDRLGHDEAIDEESLFSKSDASYIRESHVVLMESGIPKESRVMPANNIEPPVPSKEE